MARKQKQNENDNTNNGKIIIRNAVIRQRYSTDYNTTRNRNPSLEEFDWSQFESGWNGTTLRRNKAIKTANSSDVVYAHNDYAQNLYDMVTNVKIDVNKEIAPNSLVKISDIKKIDDNTIMISINNGANNVIVDLNKEQHFFNQFTVSNGDTMNKDTFLQAIDIPEFKSNLLGMDLNAKICSGSTEKASIWDGYVETLSNEMKEQVTKSSKAYWATIVSTNKGGFVVDIMNTVRAFMPGSMASANRVIDFDGMVGSKLEVMIESYDPKFGFVVSRKKYIKAVLPSKIQELRNILSQNKDVVFTGHVTGSTPFGVFVEIDDFITGMLHKTLVKDETREAMRNNEIVDGTEVKVYVHKIEGNRVILSDVPSDERPDIIAKREAEETELENNKDSK